jgi:hypothetical protein
MRRPFEQITELQQQLAVPVICAGDVFDDGWRPHKCTPELVNFALSILPKMYAVPGQHDLPHHRYTDVNKSAYWTLVEAGKIINLVPRPYPPREINVNGMILRLHGFPWGTPPSSLDNPNDLAIEIAVCHTYVWAKDYGYPGAPKEKRIKNLKESLRGFDFAIFGDNHQPFSVRWEHQTIINCGCFLRRKLDEQEIIPRAWVLYSDGSYKLQYLDISQDKFISDETARDLKSLDVETFVNELSSLGTVGVDFEEFVLRLLDKTQATEAVRQAVLKSLGCHK